MEPWLSLLEQTQPSNELLKEIARPGPLTASKMLFRRSS